MNNKEKIQKIFDEVKQLLAEDCLKIEVEPWRNCLFTLLYIQHYPNSGDSIPKAHDLAINDPAYKQLEKMINKHKFTVNIGNLSRYLSQYPNDMPVVFESWESCMTDAGTDMGGNRERDLQSIVDVDQKIIITL